MIDKRTYEELVDRLADETDVTKQLADDFVKETVAVINEGLERDERVRIAKFGIFELRPMAEREGVDPQTGEPLVIPAHTRVAFKPGRSLRRKVNRRFRGTRPLFLESRRQRSGRARKRKEPGQANPRKRLVGIITVGLVIIILIILFFPTSEMNRKPVSSRQTPDRAEITPTQPPAVAEQDLTETSVDEIETTAPIVFKTAGRDHTVRSGDRLWDLSEAHYNNAYFWPNIYRVNLDQLEHPDVIIVGMNITIPPLEGTPTNLTAKDSSDISQGYFEAYKAYAGRGEGDAKYFLWVARSLDADVLEEYRDDIRSTDAAFVEKRE